MEQYLEKLDKKIDYELEQNSPNISESFIQEIKSLEFNQEFRDYVRKKLKEKEFHDDFPFSYRSFPFHLITILSNLKVPPEKNYMIQDIINTFDIDNEVLVNFLIKEIYIYFFPKDFVEKELFKNEKYKKLYYLYY